MPGVEEVKMHIAATVDEMDRAILGMRGVVDRIDEALTRLRLITIGSAHPRAAEAVLRFEAAKEKLVEAQALTMSGVEAAQAYRGII